MFNSHIQRKLDLKKSALSEKASALSALSPLSVIKRGYSIVTDNSGKTIGDVKKLSVGETVNIRFGKGQAKATINEIKKGVR